MNTNPLAELAYIRGRLTSLQARLREHEERQKRPLGRWGAAGAAVGALAGLRSARGSALTPATPIRVGDVVARRFAGGLAEHRGVVVPGIGGGLAVAHSARSGAGQRFVSEPLAGFRAAAVHPVGDGAARQAAARKAVAATGGQAVSGYNVLVRNSDGALRKATGLRFPSQVGRAVAGAAIGAGAGIAAAKLLRRRESEERNQRLRTALAIKHGRIVTLNAAPKHLTQFAMTPPLALPGAVGSGIADKLRRAAQLVPTSALLTGGAGLAAGAALGRMSRAGSQDDESRPQGPSLLRRAAVAGLGAYAGQRWLAGPLGKLAAKRGLLGIAGRNPRLAGAALGGLASTLLEAQRTRSVEMLSAELNPDSRSRGIPLRVAELINRHLEERSEQKFRPHTVKTIARRAMMREEDIQRAFESGLLRTVEGRGTKLPLIRQSDVEALRAESLRQVCLGTIKEHPDTPPDQLVLLCRAALHKAVSPRSSRTAPGKG